MGRVELHKAMLGRRNEGWENGEGGMWMDKDEVEGVKGDSTRKTSHCTRGGNFIITCVLFLTSCVDVL